MSDMTTKSNWNKFYSAFSQVSAFIVLDKETKKIIAKIALKYSKDGAGRLSCYMYIIGNDVQIGTASGYGYDKCTASIINASDNLINLKNGVWNTFTKQERQFLELLQSDTARSGWQGVINESNGFLVIQAV